jgi:hypothetical protein
MRRSKYNAKPTVVDGVRFASKAEARRDAELQLLQRAGKISRVTRQPRFPLVVAGVKVGTYVGDWQYYEILDGPKNAVREIVEDRKGALTPVFKLKWKIVKALYPDVEFRLS